MNQTFPRSFLHAVLALAAWTIVSTIAVTTTVGLPFRAETQAAYQLRLLGPAAQIDMIVGAIVMLVFGFLAARPFRGRQAITTALLFGVLYILIEIGSSLLLSGADNLDIRRSLPTFGIKLAGALIGGFLASRRGVAEPAKVSLDKP